ncbi:MAG: serine/threonine protein kinase [Acidobacteria bacterium]|nr:serine/threonine protein kinase [Acidobacteriota bacterium]
MTIEREKIVKELFGQALEKPFAAQKSFLLEVCNNDSVYREVLSLLNSHQEAQTFLEQPVANLAAKLIQKNLQPTKKTTFLEQLIGQTLEGKYLIEKLLGCGGMGAVYKAIHLGTDRPVALKIITPEFMSNNEFVERFKREAKAAGQLSHPNVVNVTDFGITSLGTNQIAYLVMEYLKGITLSNLLEEKGKLPISFTIEIVEQVCSAIFQAHKQGIIHRDLKPDNIWLEPTGLGNYHVKVLDFGLAKFYNPTNPINPTINSINSEQNNIIKLKTVIKNNAKNNINEQDTIRLLGGSTTKNLNSDEAETKIIPKPNDEKLPNIPNIPNTCNTVDTALEKTLIRDDSRLTLETQVGTILGTPLYMSPEQCQGKILDSRSDIYSLGIIIYYMLNGSPPFKCDSLYQYIYKHAKEAPAPLKHIPKALSNLVMSTLEKDPCKRPANAQAFAIALRTILEGENTLLKESVDFYKNNFLKIFTISFVINSLFMFFNGILITFLFHTKFNLALATIIESLWIILPLLSLLIATEINTAAFTLAIEQSSYSSSKTISIKNIFLGLKQVFPRLIINLIASYLLSLLKIWKFIYPSFTTYVEHSFCSSIIILEKKNFKETFNRSRQLVANFYSLALSLKLRSFLVKFMAMIVLCLVFFLDINLDNYYRETSLVEKLFLFIPSILLLPGFFISLASPIVDIAIAKLYFKARESIGELINDKFNYQEDIKISETAKFSFIYKAITGATLMISIFFFNIFYILMVPPFVSPPKLARPKIEKIPDSENAWVEYDLAIQDLLEIPTVSLLATNSSRAKSLETIVSKKTLDLAKNPASSANLEDVAKGYVEFNDEQLAYLDKHRGAIEHLLAASKRPYAQYNNSEEVLVGSSEPNFFQLKVLTNVACAKAQQLNLQGKHKEAIELALAAYRLSIDIGAEPYASFLALFTSTVCRGIATATLFNILNSSQTEAQTDLEIAHQIALHQNRSINAYQFLEWEFQSISIILEDITVNQQFDKLEQISLDNYMDEDKKSSFRPKTWLIRTFPGLRLRVYNSYLVQKDSLLDTFQKNGLATWNYQKVKQICKEISQQYVGNSSLSKAIVTGKQILFFDLDKAIAHELTKPPHNTLSNMMSLYNTYTLSTALEIFAICSAYKKTNGEFPANLEQAMKFARLDIPKNLTNNKAVGYRLENGVPVIWFTGLDGKDDMGKKGYSRKETLSAFIADKDIIFEFGKMPLYFPPPNNQ